MEFTECLINSSVDGIIAFDRKCCYTVWNPAMECITGILKERVLGRCAFDVFPFLKKTGEDRFFFEALSGRSTVSRERSYVVPETGRRGLYEAHYSPLRNKSGEVVGGLAIVREITERKEREEALAMSHRFLEIANRHVDMAGLLEEFINEIRNFTNCEAVGIRIADEQGNIPYEAYTGFSERFYGMESPLSIKSDRCMCIDVIRGTADLSLPYYTKGASFYMNSTTAFLARLSEEQKRKTRNVCNRFGYESVALVPIRMRDQILGLIHLADHRENMAPLRKIKLMEGVAMQLGTAIAQVQIREQLRKSEQRYRNLSESLEATVEKKVAELRQAESLAAMGEFISVISHEIRNPLLNVRLGLDAIRNGIGPDENRRKILQEIDYGVNLLNGLVTDLLEYARPVRLNCSSQSIREIVRQALILMAHKLKNIDVQVDLEQTDNDVNVDPEKMTRALVNLISNAADAMPNGGEIRIWSEFAENEGLNVHRLYISDSGCGIAPEDLERVQRPFFTTQTTGTGLGIPISKKIIEAHKGSLRIESKLKEGTTVQIELPVQSS